MAYLCHIDPSPSLRAWVAKRAQSSGWNVLTHADLPQAIAGMRAHSPDLIVTAPALPSADLRETVAALRAAPGLTHVPIALLTARAHPNTLASALELGIAEVFFKEAPETLIDYLNETSRIVANIEAERTEQLRALVLDDDRALGLFVLAVLRNFGIEATLHGTINAALFALRATHFDLIVVDIVLGDHRSGNSFVRHVRRWGGKFSQLPIIVISAFFDSTRRIESLRSGATWCLDKPFSEKELTLVLEKLLFPASRPPPAAPSTSHDAVAADLSTLTEREQLICKMAIKGVPDKVIARQQGISYWTVRTYMGRIFRKLDVTNRVELACRCLEKDRLNTVAEQPPEPCPEWMSLTAHAIHNLHHGIVIADAKPTILWVNPAFTQITGFTAEEVVGQPPRILKSNRQGRSLYREMFSRLTTEGLWTGELWKRHKAGRLFLERLEIRTLPPGAPSNASYVAVISDITARGLEVKRTHHAALHDALTGLANRTLLRDRAEIELARARRKKRTLAIAFIDLDRFKPINDTLGHDIGDKVLREVAKRLRNCFRSSDTLARYGGDEFVAILPDVGTRENAQIAASKMLRAIEPPVLLDGTDCRIGASIGISIFPDDGTSFDELIACSDRAMYRAKHTGGARVCSFEPLADE